VRIFRIRPSDRKTDHSAACYGIDEEQARVVRGMFELYSVEGRSIGAIARLLNEKAIPTCKRCGRWQLRITGHYGISYSSRNFSGDG
jgi:Recombinase